MVLSNTHLFELLSAAMPVRALRSISCVMAKGLDQRGAAVAALAVVMALTASAAQASSADELSGKLTLLRGPLDRSAFNRPLMLNASDTANGLQGDVYAIVDHPLAALSSTLSTPDAWCQAMLLHVSNRRCTVSTEAAGSTLALSVVRKYDQPVDSAFRLVFDFRLIDATPQHLQVQLGASAGPLGTSNYRIAFEAIPADAAHSFLHFSYSYDENALTSVAMQAYLATFGRSKVGFSVLGRTADGQPEYIRGMHGLVERNAMRYFLAVDAYLDAPRDAISRRNAWYAATEQYPRQLHEIDRQTYLELKAADDHR
ncbi:hypothetical protein [Variovorax sp. PBL-E5]|uniref:hypothetical protein n=1 Tax=Variovorax sp. PBL-E5 TaxID=434014 RepID=UPI0013175D49|nr:hypothetical protein [Variovorax sp. PBL-E5]VTU24214.1 hypothetical protein E5CHR_01747 [Variovorax sp. PBL-E5]